MPEQVDDRSVFTLEEVARSIQKTLSDRYSSSFWVKAEMNKLNYYKHSGHCYPDLVEKKEGKIIAQLRANLWREDYRRIDHKFLTVLQEPLKDGIKILFQAKITFDAVHGLALWIVDIDPGYTLGDLEKEKQDTLKRLKNENIYQQNKLLRLPLLPQRIAIISVETSKGYADFLEVISQNPWGYRFFHVLFPALLQGDRAAADIAAQLERIKKVTNHFDVVAIIRGGGGDVGLSCYNNYTLAKTICTFPIPVITGIGHATNETVAEMVSFSNAITPTKLAEYLIQLFHDFAVPLREAERKIADRAKRILSEEKAKFQSEVKLFRSVTENVILTNRNEIKGLWQSVRQHAQFTFKQEKESLRSARQDLLRAATVRTALSRQELKTHTGVLLKDTGFQLKRHKGTLSDCQGRLQQHTALLVKQAHSELNNMAKNVTNMSPANVLRRGYSITRLNGKAVKEAAPVREGDELTTILFKGRIESVVTAINQDTDHE